ncbi:MAG: hypothetical protein J6125_01185, partial [Clostridia bacterium]|nr:hypothetical protein [Clostridia bacterium]
RVAAALDRHPAVGEQKNVEIVRREADGSLSMCVRERGSGLTLACGSGACAAAAVAGMLGIVERGAPVRVRMPGGVLDILVDFDGSIRMKGPAEFVCAGEVVWDDETSGFWADQARLYLWGDQGETGGADL